MHTGCIDPTLSLSMPSTTQLRLAPSDDHHLSSIIVRMRTICSLVPQNTVAYSTKFAQSEFRTASDERAGPGNEANAVRYRRSMTYKHVIRDRVSRSLYFCCV